MHFNYFLFILQTVKWYPLLHSKYSKNKPEIRLSIYLDEDNKEEQPSFKAKDAPARCKTHLICYLFVFFSDVSMNF